MWNWVFTLSGRGENLPGLQWEAREGEVANVESLMQERGNFIVGEARWKFR